MDVNKIQKLNQMAMNLQRHNLTLSKEDAIKNAASIYGEEHNYSQQDQTNRYSDDTNELRKDVRKLVFALKNAMNDITELKLAVSKLNKELNDLRVNQKQVQRINQPTTEKRILQPEESIQQSSNQQTLQKPIDRNGIAPSDVAIDKMFYFGQK